MTQGNGTRLRKSSLDPKHAGYSLHEAVEAVLENRHDPEALTWLYQWWHGATAEENPEPWK